MKCRHRVLFALLPLLALPSTAWAQAIGTDARLVAMGGGGATSANIALIMAPPPRAEMVIPIPLGIQVFKGGLDMFQPGSTGFDPLLAAESSGSVFHYRFGADIDSTRRFFVSDLVNGTVDPDLSVYAGFNVPENYHSEGLMASQFATTIRVVNGNDRFHGVYLGAGPYFSYQTEADVDPRLADFLGSGASYPNASMLLRDQSQIQLAAAFTVGYRGRMPMGVGGNSFRDGVYLAGNLHYLRGFKYYGPDLDVRFDTNAAGILTPTGTPFSMVNMEARSGSGFASDIGIQIVRGNIQGGVGVNGIGNHINWSDFTQATYTLPSLTAGSGFTKTPGVAPFKELRVTLPVVKTANIGVEWAGWAALATVTNGYNGTSFSGGAERELGAVSLRGGGRYSREHWDPTVGFGVGNKVGLDVALFGTHANFQDERQWALAASVRIGR